MGCSCQQQQPHTLEAFGISAGLEHAGSSELFFYIQGVRTGLQIKAAEQAKFTRLGVLLALTFGTITFLNRMK